MDEALEPDAAAVPEARETQPTERDEEEARRLRWARDDIGALMRREASREAGTGHFVTVDGRPNFDTAALRPEDADMLEKLRSGSATREDMTAYEATIFDDERAPRPGVDPAIRDVFLPFARNLFSGLQLEEARRQARAFMDAKKRGDMSL